MFRVLVLPAGEARGAGAERQTGQAALFTASGSAYDSPRIISELWAEGRPVSGNTVAKIMAGLGLQGRAPRAPRACIRRSAGEDHLDAPLNP